MKDNRVSEVSHVQSYLVYLDVFRVDEGSALDNLIKDEWVVSFSLPRFAVFHQAS